MRAYASCDHLAPTTPVSAVMMKKEMLSIRQKRGRVVEVYDGRKWPVVRCGSVYVTSEDSTHKVTQTVVTATSVAEKRRRASKYTVAVGTSHGHVQAFLEDADSVLAALDQCQAEEKCLMLIKKPKEAARKMLKSHSLSNLSVSDPQLYRQFNGLPLSAVHHPPPALTTGHHKGKRSSDEHSVTSTDTERSEPRRRYVSSKGKENFKQQQQQQQQQQHRRSQPDPHKPPDYYHSDSSSSSLASEYRNVPRRDRERDRDRDSRRRGDLRYSSIPEDAHEINNNINGGGVGGVGGKEGVSMYHSCHDLSFASQTSSANTSTYSRGQGQGQVKPGHNHPHHPHPHHPHPSDQIASDQMYGGRGQRGPPDLVTPTVHDPGDLEDAARSRSMGNLTTGLATFSLVGQRKADSMLDLPSSSSYSSAPPPPHPSSSSRHGPPPPPPPSSSGSSQAARHRSEGTGGAPPYPDHLRSPDPGAGYVRSPRHSYPESGRTPRRRSEDDEVFFSPLPGAPPPPRHHHASSNGFHNGMTTTTNSNNNNNNHHYHEPHKSHHHHHHHNQQADSAAPSGRPQHPPQQHRNGHAATYHSGSSSSTSREQTPQGDVPPPKPKRSLPHVPLNETSERIKRFTEMMSSSGSRSTANSAMSQQTPTTPHTPPSRQASFTTDNGSDCEVSTLLEARHKDAAAAATASSSSLQRLPQEADLMQQYHHHHQPSRNVRGKDAGGGGAEERGARPQPHSARQAARSQGTPSQLPYGGDATFTSSHSHSSTMDSGYTTNTEGDGDSTANSIHHPHQSQQPPHPHNPHNPHHVLSPPYHPPPPPPQYPHHSHPNHHHPHHHPQHHHQQVDEASPRVVPAPRSLSLAAARKFSSMQNVSTGHVQHAHGPPPPPAPHSGRPTHPAEWGGGGAGRNQAGAPPPPSSHSSKGPAPMRAHHPADPKAEHQRRSWDLAHNFKSLDFMPVTDSNAQRTGRAQGIEDLVVKPQAVSLNSLGGRGKPPQEAASPRRAESQRREGGQGRRGSFHDAMQQQQQQHVDNGAHLPTSDNTTTTTNHTLPGHWKVNNNGNNVNNTHNNNNNNNTKPITRNSNSNSNAPLTLPKTNSNIHNNSHNNNGDAVNTTPTLFQLSQNFNLCSAKLFLPGDLSLGKLLSLTSVQVALPSDLGSPTAQSPQGRCARLGGPGSAFRPVRSGSVGGGHVTVEMVGVGALEQPRCQQLCVLGEVRVGDVLVEVNGRQCVGMAGTTLQGLLDATMGEVTLTIARRKEEKDDSRVQQLESSLHSLQVEVQRMREELSKKDARIRELSTMLPWKRGEEGVVGGDGGGVVLGAAEEGAFVIGDNEFVV
ncbi:uncharacterized protein LOC143292421 isoform X2 [Babylonia areolata]|uniref:uncharacterized protein LOC143292421 isoform X2 n=1 Tax=Babylonia areolata TaxID=304850 RepID=UPI003FD29B5F